MLVSYPDKDYIVFGHQLPLATSSSTPTLPPHIENQLTDSSRAEWEGHINRVKCTSLPAVDIVVCAEAADTENGFASNAISRSAQDNHTHPTVSSYKTVSRRTVLLSFDDRDSGPADVEGTKVEVDPKGTGQGLGPQLSLSFSDSSYILIYQRLVGGILTG